jgi:hypothetical protein
MRTAQLYADFARHEAHGESPLYEAWALGVAGDNAIIALLDGLPQAKRQPNLVFSASRHAGAADTPYADFRE